MTRKSGRGKNVAMNSSNARCERYRENQNPGNRDQILKEMAYIKCKTNKYVEVRTCGNGTAELTGLVCPYGNTTHTKLYFMDILEDDRHQGR